MNKQASRYKIFLICYKTLTKRFYRVHNELGRNQILLIFTGTTTVTTMKKIIAGFVITFALVMSCKTNTSSPNDKRIDLTFESKSGSRTTGTATFENPGKWGSAAYHRGDIGNFTVDSNGNGSISMSTDQWCIGCGDSKKDILGKSLIVHEKADDYKTQPTGDAGGRMACSAIIR